MHDPTAFNFYGIGMVTGFFTAGFFLLGRKGWRQKWEEKVFPNGASCASYLIIPVFAVVGTLFCAAVISTGQPWLTLPVGFVFCFTWVVLGNLIMYSSMNRKK